MLHQMIIQIFSTKPNIFKCAEKRQKYSSHLKDITLLAPSKVTRGHRITNYLRNQQGNYGRKSYVILPNTIGVDFGEAARARAPSIIEKRPCIYHFLPPFPPIFWFSLRIFLASLRQCSSVIIILRTHHHLPRASL